MLRPLISGDGQAVKLLVHGEAVPHLSCQQNAAYCLLGTIAFTSSSVLLMQHLLDCTCHSSHKHVQNAVQAWHSSS